MGLGDNGSSSILMQSIAKRQDELFAMNNQLGLGVNALLERQETVLGLYMISHCMLTAIGEHLDHDDTLIKRYEELCEEYKVKAYPKVEEDTTPDD